MNLDTIRVEVYRNYLSKFEGTTLLQEGESVGTENGDLTGRALFVTKANGSDLLIADLRRPQIGGPSVPTPEDLRQLDNLDELLEKFQVKIKIEDAYKELVALVEDSDEEVTQDDLVAFYKDTETGPEVARAAVIRSVIRHAYDEEVIDFEYASGRAALEAAWEGDASRVDIVNASCPECHMVRSLSGMCDCDDDD